MPNELLMWFTNHSGEGLEIANVKATSGAFNEDFIEKRFDGLALGFLNVKPGQVGKSCGDHVPRRDGFFRVEVGRRGAKRVNAERQTFASKGRPNSHLTPVQQLLRSGNKTVFFFKFIKVNAKGQPRQISLWVNDERRNASEGGFFDQGFGHHGFSRPGRPEHGAMSGQHLRSNVDRFTGISPASKKHPFWFVLALRGLFGCHSSGVDGGHVVVEQVGN